MMRSLVGRAALLAAVAIASPLAAQDRLPQPASDSVEVELTVQAVAEVPAHGYRVQAFLGGRTATAARAVELLDVVAQLEAREMPERESCFPSSPFGFVGNELIEAAAYAEDDSAEASGEVGAGATAPRPYSGLFASREAAEDARRLLRPHSRVPAQIYPVLFDCAAAERAAMLAVLAKSQAEIETLAHALGMRNAGVMRVESPGEAQLLILSAMRAAQSTVVSDTVEMPAALTVTYRLEK